MTSKKISEIVREHFPTSSVHQARLQIYQPTRRPKWEERRIETAWGSATVRGRIGQVHADIIEAICFFAEDHRVIDATGHLQLLVDPHKIRTSVGAGSRYSHDTLWRMITELRETSITIEIPRLGIKVLGGILDRVEESKATRINPLDGKDRALWRVTLDPAFSSFISNDLHLHYDPQDLSKLPTGVAQAVARFVLTHRNQPRGGWHLDTLIESVGASGSAQTLRNRRRDMNKSSDALNLLGISLENNRVFLTAKP